GVQTCALPIYAGSSWDTSYPNVYGLTRLKFINEQTGFGICKYTYFIKTINGGQDWLVTSPCGAQNWAMDFIDENSGFVGSDGGRLYKPTDGGSSWTFSNMGASISDL